MKEVPLNGAKAAGRVALVDDEDFELVSAYRWFAADRDIAGHQKRTYAIASTYRGGKRTTIAMHALIAGPRPDHIDHNGLNNQRSNLRPASIQQNQANCRPMIGASSRYKGVSWEENRAKWRATVAGRIVGRFADEVSAARAYDAGAITRWGEFALLNFPETAVDHA